MRADVVRAAGRGTIPEQPFQAAFGGPPWAHGMVTDTFVPVYFMTASGGSSSKVSLSFRPLYIPHSWGSGFKEGLSCCRLMFLVVSISASFGIRLLLPAVFAKCLRFTNNVAAKYDARPTQGSTIQEEVVDRHARNIWKPSGMMVLSSNQPGKFQGLSCDIQKPAEVPTTNLSPRTFRLALRRGVFGNENEPRQRRESLARHLRPKIQDRGDFLYNESVLGLV